MYLSRLEIQGFKSFAQRVGLGFDSGISAIVGPNGCGKTNIVDAIRWVLGEQRYSALRSEKMEDVIFNGTKARKPLGMAEASLVIENTRGILPSEYAQVTVGRRVYRSGESEYLLNRVPCRLKDILDLFMDTGMGSDAYSVIELKMVEVILSDKTDERRRLFEEAAGVTKYKHRRKAAYRKLESVQADLVRVNDIVTEIQKAVHSLERQARRAEQYNNVKERLRAMEIDLMEREFSQFHSRMVPLQERFSTLDSEQSRLMVGLSEEEALLEGLRTSTLEVEKRHAEAQRDAATQREEVRRMEQKNLVAAERVRALQENSTRLRTDGERLHSEQRDLLGRKATLEERSISLAGQESTLVAELQAKQEGLRAFGALLDEKKEGLQGLNERIIALVQQIAEATAEQDRRRSQAEHLRGRAEHAAEENAAYGEEILRLQQQVAGLTAEDRKYRHAFAESEMRAYEAEARRTELQEKIREVQRQRVEIRASTERDRAKVDFLKGLLESREGLSEGVRFLSASEGWKPAHKLTVADAIHAEERYRAAIEAALGEAAGLLVVDDPQDAERGIALLKQEEKGKATFIVLGRVPLIRSRLDLPEIPGVIGWASALANYDRQHERLFRFLLDRVLVVDTLATAREVADRVAGIRCVTLDGEIGSGSGIARGGSKRQDEGGTIGKHRQIDELVARIADAEMSLSVLQDTQKKLQEEHDAVDLKGYLDAVKEIEKEMNGVEMRIAQLEFEKKRASDSIARNADAIASFQGEAHELDMEITSDEPRLQLLGTEKSSVERSVGGGTQELTALEEEWNARSVTVNEIEIALVRMRNDLQNTRTELERTVRALEENAAATERTRLDLARGEEEIASIGRMMQETEEAARGLLVELGERERIGQRIEAEALRLREEAHQRELRLKDHRRAHDESLRQAHDAELKLQDLRAKAEHLRLRAREEFEIDLELKQYPDHEFVDFAALRDEIQALRDKMKNLGNINFAAFEEYTEEKKRYEFLSTQRKDLLDAEKTLLAAIEEINATAQKKFLDTFALIRSNFIETFKGLFDPGDECDLRLEEGVDPLEAAIDIVAKPRGKRPTSIDLLSGGEKTLTAIALLFAIYLVKPSPFCILDEVDAPLDDANIDRFTRILRKFSDNTQFIVVTHNKKTMEAANALYGVTMEEEGVSKIVTVRFNQQSQIAVAAVASA